jgi:hypothetical protein
MMHRTSCFASSLAVSAFFLASSIAAFNSLIFKFSFTFLLPPNSLIAAEDNSVTCFAAKFSQLMTGCFSTSDWRPLHNISDTDGQVVEATSASS